MCGLVGYVITAPAVKPTEVDRYLKWVSKALLLDTVRGFHSTGVSRITQDMVCETMKKAVPGYDFVDMSQYNRFLTKTETLPIAVLGHNRAATQGAVNTDNAHPFTHGDVTMMHNGTLHTTAGVGSKFEVDSENICYSLSLCNKPKDVVELLEDLDGAFALVWYDRRDNTINFARNDERPLVFRRTEEGWLYASEGWIIDGALSEPFATEIRTKSVNTSLKVGEWHRINAQTGEVTSTPFVPDAGWAKWMGSSGSGTSSSNSSASYVEASYMDLKRGDPILVQYESHNVHTYGPNATATVHGRIVSHHPSVVLPPNKVTLSGYDAKEIEGILNDKRIFTARYGGCYTSQHNDKSPAQVWVSDHRPSYSIQDRLDFKIPPECDYTAAEYDDIAETEGDQLYNCDNELLSVEDTQTELDKGCAWCGSPLTMKDEMCWIDGNLLHAECGSDYDEEMNQ